MVADTGYTLTHNFGKGIEDLEIISWLDITSEGGGTLNSFNIGAKVLYTETNHPLGDINNESWGFAVY